MQKLIIVMESWGVGGTETYVSGLARMLVSRNFDVSIVFLSAASEKNIDFISPDKVFVCPLSKVNGLLRALKADIVNLHLYTSLLSVTFVCWKLKMPTVTTLHMPINSWGLRNRLKWKLAIYLASIVVGVSDAVIKQLKISNVINNAIPGGVALEFFDTKRVRIRKINDYFRIIAVGRHSTEKSWSTLINAVAYLPLETRLLVVIDFYGTGSQSDYLKMLVSSLHLNANFYGEVEKHEICAALEIADLSVLPSQFEGLGLSALEAMAVGVPTIVADFAAASEFIKNGVTGNLFPRGDVYQLSQLIMWHVHNPDLSKEIGVAGREYVRDHFSEHVTYNPYLKVFNEIV
jgi:glycosyltransferase involved in cell wall biosynthesis